MQNVGRFCLGEPDSSAVAIPTLYYLCSNLIYSGTIIWHGIKRTQDRLKLGPILICSKINNTFFLMHHVQFQMSIKCSINTRRKLPLEILFVLFLFFLFKKTKANSSKYWVFIFLNYRTNIKI